MNVFLLILAGILLLIILLLFSPLVVKVVYEEKVKVRIGLFFPVFPVPVAREEPTDPKKIKKAEEKKRKKEEKKKKRELKKQQKEEKRRKKKGLEEEEKKESFLMHRIKSKGVGGVIELLKELVRILGLLVKKITDHLVISRMDLQIALASEDAAKTAVSFGYVCSAVFPLVSFIEQNVYRCRHREQIVPVFTETKTRVRFVMRARILPFFLLSAAFAALFRAIKALAK